MTNVKHITTDEFDSEVLASTTPTLVDFYATWCPPCKMLTPILDQLAREYGDRVKFVKVNTDQEYRLAAKYGIQGPPTLMFFADGQLVDKVAGVPPVASLRQKLDALAGRSNKVA